MTKIAIYPGSFDPITYGHLDIIKRSLKIVDKLVIALGHNNLKNCLFSIEERKHLISESLESYLSKDQLVRIEIKDFKGMLIDFALKEKSNIIIRGIRIYSDFDFEFNLAGVNSKLCPEIDTIFLTTSENKQFISSKFVKEIAYHKGDTSLFVPKNVSKALVNKLH